MCLEFGLVILAPGEQFTLLRDCRKVVQSRGDTSHAYVRIKDRLAKEILIQLLRCLQFSHIWTHTENTIAPDKDGA